MILANKCDMNDRRQVSRERGSAVSCSADWHSQIIIIIIIIFCPW